MKQKLYQFFSGRRGMDELNICLLVLYVILVFLSRFVPFLSTLALVCIIYALFRSFSRNIYARQKENKLVAPWFSLIRAWFKNRKTHKVFMCPKCKRTLRIPKGKGKVTVKCPCGNAFKRKS